MSPEAPVSSRLKSMCPENGYQTPQSQSTEIVRDCFGNGMSINSIGEERRRQANSNGISNTRARPTSQSQEDIDTNAELGNQSDEEGRERKYGFRDRVGCYTWTFYTMTMATGGVANVLHSIPYQSKWLRICGVVVFLFNIVLFTINCTLITLRFRWNSGSFRSSFTNQSESLFILACVVSMGTILINSAQFGIPYTGPWFQTVMQVCFWAYAAISFVTSSGMYLIIWSTQTFPIHTMTPIWIFPAYPALLVAPLASNIISSLPDAAAAQRINAVTIAFGAVCVQGTGFMVSLMIYSAFIYRLMTQKLPREKSRPGMFVSVGPSGFTVAGLVNLGSNVDKIMPHGYMGDVDAAKFLRLLSIMVGLWIWGLCLWFFLVSLGAHWQIMQSDEEEHQINFDMTWYSFVFPNTALITATFAIGKSLESHAINIFGTVLAAMLVPLWLFIFYKMVRALVFKRLLWPGEIDGAEISWRKWIGQLTHEHKQSGVLKSSSGRS